MNRYEELKKYLIENRLCLEDDIKGSSEDEIKEKERAMSISFPNDYRLFLEVFGNGAGPLFFSDVDFVLDSIRKNTDDFILNFPEIWSQNDKYILVVFARYSETYGYFEIQNDCSSRLIVVTADDDEISYYDGIYELLFEEAKDLVLRHRVR